MIKLKLNNVPIYRTSGTQIVMEYYTGTLYAPKVIPVDGRIFVFKNKKDVAYLDKVYGWVDKKWVHYE